MWVWFSQLVQAGRCHKRSTAFFAQRLQVSIHENKSPELLSRAKMLIRISFGSLSTVARHASSSLTCMSWRPGTPRDDWESFAPRKKSDSSLSAGAGELVEDEDRESCRSSVVPPCVAITSRDGAAGRIVQFWWVAGEPGSGGGLAGSGRGR
jgi:hypothetical protein